MFDDSKEFSIFMVFDLQEDELASIRALCGAETMELQYEQDGLEGRLILSNIDMSSVEFESIVARVRATVADRLYADRDTTLEECVVRQALERGVKIGVAESLTGGMVCSRIVNVSGASSVLQEGLVTYTDAAKVRRLHVKLSTLENSGVVSAEVAREMVAGLLANKEIALGVSTTGCAGPASDEYDTPVGLAYVAVGDRNRIETYALMFDGTRNHIRKCTTDYALHQVLEYLKKL